MRERLVQLIEAYAAAAASGNKMLIGYATEQLNEFLESVTVEQKEQQQ